MIKSKSTYIYIIMFFLFFINQIYTQYCLNTTEIIYKSIGEPYYPYYQIQTKSRMDYGLFKVTVLAK